MTASQPQPKSGSANAEKPDKSNSSSKYGVGNVLKLVLKLVLVLVTLVAYCAVVPVFGVFMIPIYLYRFLVIRLQKILKPDWVGIMSSRDAIVGLDNTTKNCECMIMAAMGFRGDPDIEKCREHFRKNVMELKNSKGGFEYQKFTHYYENWMGFPFWKEEEDFKLENHFRLFDYPVTKSKGLDGEEIYVTEDELLRQMGEMEALPFPKGRSPWEILILPNYIPRKGNLHKEYSIPAMTVTDPVDDDKEKHFMLVFRIHHAIGDGYSSLKMFMCNMCGEPVESVPRAPVRKYSFFARIVNSIAIFVFTPYFHFKEFFLEIDRSLWHLPSRKLANRSHFVTTEMIPMESLKRIGKSYKVPLTGVFLAGLAGGIHNFLMLTGKGHLIPKFMRAFSPMPWTNHPAYSGGGMVNHWTAGVFAIPVQADSPQKRLRASKKAMRDLASSPILVTNFFTIPMLLAAPKFLTDFWGTNWMTSMILSNFPGPTRPTKGFGGDFDLEDAIVYVPHMRGSAGFGVMFPTCLGNVRATVSVDVSIMKDYSDAQFLVSLIQEEFRILMSLYPPNAENRV